MSFGGIFSKKPYLEQFNRVKRWNNILKQIQVSNSSENKTDYQVDCILAFFINCHHLRDWLEYSKAVSKEKLNELFKNNVELRICRDICNKTKHLSLNRSPSVGSKDTCNKLGYGVTLHREYNHFALPTDLNPVKNISYVVVAAFEKYNAFELADKCLNLWEDFLKQNSLL